MTYDASRLNRISLLLLIVSICFVYYEIIHCCCVLCVLLSGMRRWSSASLREASQPVHSISSQVINISGRTRDSSQKRTTVSFVRSFVHARKKRVGNANQLLLRALRAQLNGISTRHSGDVSTGAVPQSATVVCCGWERWVTWRRRHKAAPFRASLINCALVLRTGGSAA